MMINERAGEAAPGFISNDRTPGETGGDTLTIRGLLGILSYRRRLVVMPAIVLMILAALVTLQIPNRYTSTAEIMLNVKETNIVNIDNVISTLPNDTRLVEGEILLITSNEALLAVLTKLGLLDDLEQAPDANASDTGGASLDPGAAKGGQTGSNDRSRSGLRTPTAAEFEVIEAFRDVLDVSQVGLSRVISISAQWDNPVGAAIIANSIAQEYIESRVKVKTEATRDAAASLRERAEVIRQRLEESESDVEAFKASMLTGASQTVELWQRQLSEFNSQFVVARSARAAAEAQLTEITRRIDTQGLASAELLLESASLTKLRAEVESLAIVRSEMATKYGPSNPRLNALDAQIKDLEGRIEDEIARAVDGLEGEVATAREREKEIVNGLAEMEGRLTEQSANAVRLRQLERVVEANRNIYETFLSRLNELVEQIDIQQADARMISSAIPAEAPSGPNRTRLVILAAVFGLFVGCAMAFASEAMTVSFRTDIEMAERLGLRVLARIPRIEGAELLPLQVLEHTRQAPLSEIVRAVREIIVVLSGGAKGTILVTSANPIEGRTTLCLLIASFLSRIGRKSIVIDCDFQNPAIGQIFDVSEGKDLMDVIASGAPIDEAIRSSREFGIDFIPILDMAEYKPEILYTDTFRNMLDGLKKRYDFVLLDAAPLSLSPDACAMSRSADLVLFAVRWYKTSEHQVKTGIAKLFQFGARRIDTALTFIESEDERRYRRRVHNLDES